MVLFIKMLLLSLKHNYCELTRSVSCRRRKKGAAMTTFLSITTLAAKALCGGGQLHTYVGAIRASAPLVPLFIMHDLLQMFNDLKDLVRHVWPFALLRQFVKQLSAKFAFTPYHPN